MSQGIDLPKREKRWSEKDQDERLEFLKKELRDLCDQVNSLAELYRKLIRHQHVGDNIVEPIDHNSVYVQIRSKEFWS